VVVNDWLEFGEASVIQTGTSISNRSGRIAMGDEVAFTNGWLHIRDDAEDFLGGRQ